jgi:hypothetical protein
VSLQGVKAVFEVTLIIPSKLMALSNMPETEFSERPNGEPLHHSLSSNPLKHVMSKGRLVWDRRHSRHPLRPDAEDVDIPAGLRGGRVRLRPAAHEPRGRRAGVHAAGQGRGEFPYLGSIKRCPQRRHALIICTERADLYTVWVTTDSHGYGGVWQEGRFALRVATQTLDIYDDFFSTPYPLPKLDMVAIPEFAMGAMENWGLVTYREVRPRRRVQGVVGGKRRSEGGSAAGGPAHQRAEGVFAAEAARGDSRGP